MIHKVWNHIVLLSMFLRELHVFTINRHDSQGLESQSINVLRKLHVFIINRHVS